MRPADRIRAAAGAEPIRAGLVLGSGLGHLADAVDGVSVAYADLPGFPQTGVSGHSGRLAVGWLEGVRVAVLAGRAHYYERGEAGVMRPAIETLAALGADRVILTNAAGSLRPKMGPGSVMAVSDHINFAGANPLIGEETDAKFVDLVGAYDAGLRADLSQAAVQTGVEMPEGVYAWCAGPSFETPAEIRALRTLGADAVGMSTVPEVILARFFGMKAAAVSVITNLGAGLGTEALSHEHTKSVAQIGAAKLERVLRAFLGGSTRA